MYKYIIFDLGGVLIDWDPRHLYRRIFTDEHEMESFLSQVCTPDWNEKQDAGRSLAEATSHLIGQFPEYSLEISMYYGRWEEMLNGPIEETVAILQKCLADSQLKVFALTNWSAETFPIAMARFDFLHLFHGIVVSGHEGMKKPDPDFYQLLFERFDIDPGASVFIDDSLRNIQAARALGMLGIHFLDAFQLKQELIKLEII